MTISLGGIELNPGLVWAERYGYSPVIQEVQTTLDGYPVIYTRTRIAGMPITLVAMDDQGWLTKAMADSLQISANAPGSVLSLVIGDEQFTVVFRHNEPPAVALRPLIPRAVPLPEDYFVGEIKLMTV